MVKSKIKTKTTNWGIDVPPKKKQEKVPQRQFLQNCAQRKWSATQNKRNKNNQPTIHIPKIEDNSENDRSK